MLLRIVAGFYRAYLVAPILLLFVGSFGELRLNTLWPSGFTLEWYVEVANAPSFRRGFFWSLFVAGLTCVACVAIGVPLAYAVLRARSPRVRALASALYQLPVALPPRARRRGEEGRDRTGLRHGDWRALNVQARRQAPWRRRLPGRVVADRVEQASC